MGNTETLLDESERVAEKLRRKTDYDIGQMVYADFCSLASEHLPSGATRKREIEAWVSMTDLDGNFASRAFAELFRLGRFKEIESANPSDTEAHLAQAMVLAHDPATQHKAKTILQRYSGDHDTTYMQMRIVQLQLILGMRNQAQAHCRQWLLTRESSSPDKYESFRLEVAQHLVDGTLHELETETPWQEFIRQYNLALWSYSNPKAKPAKEHLEYCVRNRSMDVTDHWARAFLRRWE